MNLGGRLKKRRLETGLSQSEIAEKIGIQQGTIGLIERRDQKSTEHAPKIAEILGVRLEWLLTGEEPMTASIIPTQNIVAVDIGDDKSNTHNNILRYDVKLSAGGGTAEWIVRENDDDPIFFRKGWFKARRLYADNLRGMYVRGDSMEPYLFNHDTVIIDVEDTDIIDGETYAVIFKDRFYVKELRGVDGEISIISKNDKYPPMQTDKAEAADYNNYFQVLGHVVWRGG